MYARTNQDASRKTPGHNAGSKTPGHNAGSSQVLANPSQTPAPKTSKVSVKKPLKAAGALVDLNVNPCKMCMPMGTCMAAYGVRGTLSILHGSQGCATYIRRHMATHFNEPVDIASSSLTEQGTVYGGEENLRKGIDNLIRLYSPELVCVSTTCLAETIGEDTKGILERWRQDNPASEVEVIAVSAPGYGGSEYEGFFRFSRALLEQIEMRPHNAAPGQLNLICGPLSPADLRTLKQLLAAFALDAVILPDISDNLDRPHLPTYERLPQSGTPLNRIRGMAGSLLTIELALNVNDNLSPAALLRERYGVPYRRLAPPVSLRDMDTLVAILAEFSGRRPPEQLQQQRGRYLDAMVDSHKYNAEGKAAIFGEADFCYSTARMCLEQGIVPVLVAAGSKAPGLRAALEAEIAELAERFMLDSFTIIDEADFGTIERLCAELGVNLLFGSSDGRRIEESQGIPLVRCAFPIHDRIGGQRVTTIGYEGSLNLVDRATNALLERKQSRFRRAIFDEFFTSPKRFYSE
ncbi:MAG: hypothetical protein LBU07_06105 [Coriobacteriales bacterium]|jgi:nitrogenase molybdenum-iron protein alpha/beta subunit|nr:hypothetical protein [Coriobacteriales bacterium]